VHQARSLLFVLLLVVLTGCEGARPIEDVSIPENPPDFSIPDSTLATLVRAIHDRSTTNFGLVFADTVLEAHEFHAVFDSIDIIEWHSAGHPTYPQDWRRHDEMAFFPNFVANFPDQLYDTYFTVDDARGGKINIGGPTQMQIWNMHYRVWAGSTPVAAGSAGLTFERIGLASEYKLTYWEDRRDTVNVRSWGKHRLEGR